MGIENRWRFPSLHIEEQEYPLHYTFFDPDNMKRFERKGKTGWQVGHAPPLNERDIPQALVIYDGETSVVGVAQSTVNISRRYHE